jgi:hypothetical protein
VKKPLLVLAWSALPLLRCCAVCDDSPPKRPCANPFYFDCCEPVSETLEPRPPVQSRRLREYRGNAFPALQRRSALRISARCCEDPSRRPDFLVAGIPKRAVERLDNVRSLCRRWDHHALSIFPKGRNDRGSDQPRPLVAVQRFKNQSPGRSARARDRPHGARKRKNLRPRRANPFCSQEK